MVNLRTVPSRVEDVANNPSELIALTHGERVLSYRDLNLQANRFAKHLRVLGAGPGSTVALCMERSIDWIVAALGIMRAGAAYVPLDMSWPEARIRYAVSDCGASILVARPAMLKQLGLRIPGVEPSSGKELAPACDIELHQLDPQSLAYIIYTSGSTGLPKGVEITHANLSHLIKWYQASFSIGLEDRVSHLLGLAFDAVVLEVWAHLCAGANLFIADEGVRMSHHLFQDWVLQQRLTVALVPTALGARLMAMTWPADTSLRLLVVGGEALRNGPDKKIPFKVVNQYGPTECTVVSTSSVLKAGMLDVPAIGRPIDGVAVYLLDEGGEPVPDGSVGEIYIGGEGVGRGYRNLPELTRERFVLDPFIGLAGARMYRSGDRGRLRPDGEIEFHGRLDRQTKIRGFRIELDEISSVLQCYPGVEFATVIARASDSGDDELVAYVLPLQGLGVTSVELQAYLAQKVPDFMVPAIFIRLESLPLSPNGKIDLSALSKPGVGRPIQRTVVNPDAMVVPCSLMEDKLLEILREVLRDHAITVEDNFFLVGGHSLLGMQLVMRIETAFGVSVTLKQLFEAPSVRSLAVLLEFMMTQQRLAAIWRDVLRTKHVDPNDSFFDLGGKVELITSLQKRIEEDLGQHLPIDQLVANATLFQQADLVRRSVEIRPMFPSGVLALQPKGTRNSIFWIHYFNVNLAKLVGDDQPFLVVRLMAEDFASLAETSTIEEIAACHVQKILSTQPVGPYTIGGLCLGGILAFAIAQQLQDAGHEVLLLVMLDPPSPSYLGLERGFSPRMSQPRYLLRRAVRLGLRASAVKMGRRLFKHLIPSAKKQIPSTEIELAQELIENAASTYEPGKYHGRVLLLLASERPPHVDFLPGWQALIPSDLHTQYLEGHHEELTRGLSAQRVADAIFSHLTQASEQKRDLFPAHADGKDFPIVHA